MTLEIHGEITPKKDFLEIYNGNFSFETHQYGGYNSEIYILREKNHSNCFSNTHIGLTSIGDEEELLNLMIPSFLERNFGKEQSQKGIPKSERIDNLQIIGFGPYISQSAEEIAEKWGFKKINTFFSDFTGSKLQQEFDKDPKNRKFFSGTFYTKGLMNYSVKEGKSIIKIVDSKSVHNGITYINSQNLKFEGEISDAPRHLEREEKDEIILPKNLERKLIRGQRYVTFINKLSDNTKEEYFSEKSIYLGRSGEEQKHKLLLGASIFKKDINGYFCLLEKEMLHPTIIEFTDYKLNNRDFLILNDPITLLKLSQGEKEYLEKVDKQ